MTTPFYREAVVLSLKIAGWGWRGFPQAEGHKLRAAKTSNRTPEAVISFHHMSGCGPCLDGSMSAMAFPSSVHPL